MSNQQDTKKKNPNVPNLRFPSFTCEWEKTRLTNVGQFLPGLTYKPDDVSKNGRLVLRSCNIQNGELTLYDSLFVKESIVKPALSVRPYDVLMCIRNGSKKLVGKTALVLSDDAKLTWGAFMAIIRPNNSCSFLFHYLNSPSFRKQIFPDTNTATVNQITASIYNRCNTYLPNQEEQQRIASLLDIFDRRISVQNKIIRDLESQIVAINNRFFDSLQSVALFQDLYECAGEGGTPDTKERDYYEPAEIPFIKIENLYEKYLRSHSEHISKIGLRNSSAWLVSARCVLLSNGATIGECTITTYPVCTKQGILGIVPSSQTSAEFLYLLFKSRCFKRKLRRITTKGTMDAAYLKDINQMIVPFCNQKEQQRHIGAMKPFEEKLEMEKRLLFCLKKEKEYLLRNLFI